ncbi:MAG: hypothetical protein NVSMB23_14270 [Myxococcales bacterium]
MKKLQLSVLVFTALTAIGALVATAANAETAQVWVAPSAQKVRPQTQPAAGSAAAASIAAAKNEFESFHVVVTGAARGVSMQLSSLDDGRGHVISGRDLVLYREALINVTLPSGGDGATGRWPDALIPDVDPVAGEKRNAFPFDVPAGESRAVLVDVHVPQTAVAGTYRGTVVVSGGVAAQVPVTLVVWDFAVPSTSTLRSSFGLAWNGPCMGHHGDENCGNAAAERALRARYVQVALDNHVSVSNPSLSTPVERDGTANWSTYDAESAPFLDGTAATRLKGARLTSARIIARGPTTTAVAAAWSKHFTGKGWHDALFDYTCDEPPMTCAWKEIQGRIAQVKAADPLLPALVTTTVTQAKEHGITNIDLFAPVVNFMDDKPNGSFPGSQRGSYGGNVWWYQSCMSFGCAGVGGAYAAGSASYESGWPTMAIDADGTRNRAMEWLSFSYGMSGELYYEMALGYFTGNPWDNQYNFGGTGDGTLFYPGTPARIGGKTEIPVESLRLKMIRDGMEDFELLMLARKLGVGDQAMQIAKGVYPRTFHAVSTPAALDAGRAELARLILHALGKDKDTAPVAIQTAAASLVPANRDTVSSVLPKGGCSSSGADLAWVALPLLGLFLRRRRAA